MLDISVADIIIYGRVKPHIYAFETNTVPNYLKVGDTYRPVSIRLDEWRKLGYIHLEKIYDSDALIDDNTYFRDYAVHQHLTYVQHVQQITDSERQELSKKNNNLHISVEFFRNATKNNVSLAISAIKESFAKGENRYTFYDTIIPNAIVETEYERTESWKPRRNQEEVINNFVEAYKAGRRNLLMFAVMRFGKSFTAL